MLNGDGNENKKKINSSNQEKKNNFASGTHFFAHFFAVVVEM